MRLNLTKLPNLKIMPFRPAGPAKPAGLVEIDL
jgi:hypothetical protein